MRYADYVNLKTEVKLPVADTLTALGLDDEIEEFVDEISETYFRNFTNL